MLDVCAFKRAAAIGCICLAFAGCSVRRFAISKLGNAIASGGSNYESDDDLELVGAALPFGLKLIESLLADVPRHKPLLLAACQGFALYSYVYVQWPAEVLATTDLDQAAATRARARRLYLRAHRYGFRALEAAYPGLTASLAKEPKTALAAVQKQTDVPLLYWNAVALGLAVSTSRADASMLARLPEVEALIDRALELNPEWNEGALQEFQVSFSAAKPGIPDHVRIRRFYEKALELSGGKRAGLHLAYAEASALPRQDRAEFLKLIDHAIAVGDRDHESARLANIVARRRAQWLAGRVDELVLSSESEQEGEKRERK